MTTWMRRRDGLGGREDEDVQKYTRTKQTQHQCFYNFFTMIILMRKEDTLRTKWMKREDGRIGMMGVKVKDGRMRMSEEKEVEEEKQEGGGGGGRR